MKLEWREFQAEGATRLQRPGGRGQPGEVKTQESSPLTAGVQRSTTPSGARRGRVFQGLWARGGWTLFSSRRWGRLDNSVPRFLFLLLCLQMYSPKTFTTFNSFSHCF